MASFTANHKIFWVIGLLLLVVLIVMAAAMAFGGPKPPKPLDHLNSAFRGLDYSAMPAISRYTARDGASLAYRHYDAKSGNNSKGSIVLLHGSSASSMSTYPLARALAQAGWQVEALDVRGHGESGIMASKGDIAYIGQLEDDLEDFMKQAKLSGAAKVLMGFSAGGGFALRFAGDARQKLFDRYVLLAPMLHQDSPTMKPITGNGAWVSVGVPRIAAVITLNAAGITAFNHLPVIAFALDEQAKKILTPSYSYALMMNYRPHNDYANDLRNAKQPMQIIVGTDDEQFYADRYESVLRSHGNASPVTLVKGVDHIQLTLKPEAHSVIIAALEK